MKTDVDETNPTLVIFAVPSLTVINRESETYKVSVRVVLRGPPELGVDFSVWPFSVWTFRCRQIGCGSNWESPLGCEHFGVDFSV